MDSYEPPFNWMRFPEGHARFSGGVRGIIDEQRHETFSVEVDGNECFGEIQATFLPNNNDYNIEVVSFGYGSDDYVGMPMLDACQVFTAQKIATVQALIVQLIHSGTLFSERPSILKEYQNARFMGEVIFRDGWALIANDARTS